MSGRNPWLTPGMERMIQAMRHDLNAEGEAVEEGIEVWVGYRRFSSRTLRRMLQLCLVRSVGDRDPCGVRRYTLSSDAIEMLNDPSRVPEIVLLQKQAAPHGAGKGKE